MIEIIEPHPYESNIEGYNVEPCVADVSSGRGFTLDPARGSRPSRGGLLRR